jgi:hypothetical protein
MYTRRQACLAAARAAAAVVAGSRLRADPRPDATPGPRAGHAMAFHGGAAAICLIGGDRAEPEVARERPWFWDGKQWTMRTGDRPDAPGVASLVALVSDAAEGSVIAYGGFSVLAPRKYGPPQDALWELDAGLAWRRHPAAGEAPGPRHHHAMAFDAARRRLVLYGGIDASDGWPTDTWEWDRVRWSRVSTAGGPGERAHHAMTFDAARGQVVLRGGTRRDRVSPTDTWVWNGRLWERAAVDGPGPGDGYRLAYDPSRRVTVLFGGETVTWDGRAWMRRAPSGATPAARTVHALATDPRRERVVLYGGSARTPDNFTDTWEWDGTGWTRVG